MSSKKKSELEDQGISIQNVFTSNHLDVKYLFNLERIYLTIILRAPRGVTSAAGANMYAAKLASSPTTTDKNPKAK